jgi:hypothetical protein
MAAISTDILKELAFAINRSVGEAIQAGAKAVIIPERQKFLSDIKRDLESGQIDKVEGVVDQLSNVISDMGTDLKSFGNVLQNDLVANLKDLVQSKKDADEEVSQLQQGNIKAQTRLIERDKEVTYQAVVMTNRELRAERDQIIKEEKDILKDEKQLQKEIKEYQNSEERDDEKAKELADRQMALIKRQEKNEDNRNKLQLDKSKSFLDELAENVPSGIKDMFSSFTDTLMAPIQAFKGVGRIFLNLGKGIGQIVKLFGTLAKGLARMLMSVLAATAGFLAAALPFLLIGGLIIALGYGLKKLMDKLDIFGDDEEKRKELEEKQAQSSSDRAQEIQDVQQENIEKRNVKIDEDIKDTQDQLANLDKEYEDMSLLEKAYKPSKDVKRKRLESKLKGLQEQQYRINLKSEVLELIEKRRADGETVAGTVPDDLALLQQMKETGGLMPHEMIDKGITPVEKGTGEYPNIIYQQNDNSTTSKNNASVSAGVSITNPEQSAYRAAFEGSH